NNAGRILINWSSRRPILLATLKTSLGTESIELTTTNHPSRNPKVVSVCRFESYSEAGATLVIFSPELAPDAGSLPNFTLGVKAQIVTEAGLIHAIPNANLGQYLRFEMVEGNV